MSKDLEYRREYSEHGISVIAVPGFESEQGERIAALGGEQFGKYLLVGEIARGGMGEVYLGVQQGPEGFSKTIVVKRMVRHLTKRADFIRMFIDEARLAARLEHPNIVKTYEFGEHEGQYYTVMEFLAGEDLRKMLHKLQQPPHRRLALSLAVHLVAQICNGLHFAHELTDHEGRLLGLVHRDVNPANVIVTYSGEVKVIDFGVAKVNTASKKTLAGVIKGKIAYMSPEQILARDVDRRSDIFSTGVILWEMLMGRSLFARDSDAATMYAVMNDPIPRPGKERSDVPPQLDTIVARALARTPGDRFGTADDMRAALDDLAAELPKCDGRVVGRMMEKLFGNTRAQAKRSITQSRSLAHNISLVMKMTTAVPDASLPTVVLPAALSPSGASPSSKSPVVALPASRGHRRWWVIDSAIAGLCGVAAVAAFGPWSGASTGPLQASPLSRPDVAIERAAAPVAAAELPDAEPLAAQPPTAELSTALPSVAPRQRAAGRPIQGTLTVETYSNAMVYLDGKTIEHGSFFHRPTTNGTHEIVVKIPGHAPLKRLISIAAARETRLKIELVHRNSAVASRPPASDREAMTSKLPASPLAARASPQAQDAGSSAEHDPAPAVTEPRPAATIAPVVKRPSLDIDATRIAVRSQLGPLQQCYERAKMDDANLRGRVTARITVAADGAIANAQIAASTLNSAQVEGCLTREISRWHLPRPSGGAAVSFQYPFVFE